MLKTLLLVLPATLFIAGPTANADPVLTQPVVVQSGRSGAVEPRSAWFERAVGDILQGKVDDTAAPPSTPR